MRINQLSPVNLNTGTDSPMRTGERRAVESVSAVQQLQAASNSSDNAKAEHEEFNEEMLQQSVNQANKVLAEHNRVVERSIHEVTKTVMYTVKDTVTHEVIAEFPPKRIQDMIAKMWELAGLFVDEKA
ncbi:MAG: flagellar protein FlaG [Bacillota bacterium]|nr:flagellar protein FlaG [Bacillota bacterium]